MKIRFEVDYADQTYQLEQEIGKYEIRMLRHPKEVIAKTLEIMTKKFLEEVFPNV